MPCPVDRGGGEDVQMQSIKPCRPVLGLDYTRVMTLAWTKRF